MGPPIATFLPKKLATLASELVAAGRGSQSGPAAGHQGQSVLSQSQSLILTTVLTFVALCPHGPAEPPITGQHPPAQTSGAAPDDGSVENSGRLQSERPVCVLTLGSPSMIFVAA